MSNTDILNKTWTLSDSEENFAEDEKIMNETHFIDPTSPEFLLNNLSLAANQTRNIDVSMQRSYTSFNTSPRSTTFSVKATSDEPNHSLHQALTDFRSLGAHDFNRHSMDIENFLNKICTVKSVSLFDEDTSGLDFENGEPICIAKNNLTINLNETQNLDQSTNLNQTHNLNKTTNISPKKKSTLNKHNLTVNLNSNANLTVNLSPNRSNTSEIADQPLPQSQVDRIPAPNSFDTFVDDLKSSTSEVVALDSPIEFSINNEKSAFNLNNPNLKMMTSSVDKDLHKTVNEGSKEMFKNRLISRAANQFSNLVTNKNLTSSNFDLDEIQETSSPFRPLAQKQSLNSSYTIEKKSLDFGDGQVQNNPNRKRESIPKRNKFDSNESLNDNDETSSKSSSSNQDPGDANFRFQQLDNDLEGQFLANQTADLLDDDPRTVFNQTYTSWATNDEQLMRDAAQQAKNMANGMSNVTQNFQVDTEDAKANLNRTMDIINDEDLMDTDSADPVKETLNRTHEIEENLNRTREIEENLNRTREIIDDADVEMANESTIAPIEARPKTEAKSSKRLSLISSNGFVLPVVEDTTIAKPAVPSPPRQQVVSTKLPSPPKPKTAASNMPAPAASAVNANFEFKKPAIPRLSPPKVSTRLPTTKTSIPSSKLSFGFPAPVSKTLSVNNSTSNILRPSGMQAPSATSKSINSMSGSTDRLKMRSSMIASTRLVPTEATKENNGQRMSMYVGKTSTVSRSTNSALLKPQTVKSLKVSPTSTSKVAAPSTSTSRLAMPTKISYSTQQSMIPSFKTSSLPVSKMTATASRLPKKANQC